MRTSENLDKFTTDWWEKVVDNKDVIQPIDWLVVIGTMVGMLSDAVTETEEEAKSANEIFNKIVSQVSMDFVETSISSGNIH